MVRPVSRTSRKAPAKPPAKPPLINKRLLIGAVVFGTLVILVSFCAKEDPIVDSEARLPQVVVPSKPATTVAGDPVAVSVENTATDAETPPLGSLAVRFKTPIVRGGPGVEVLAEGMGSNDTPLTFEYEWRVNREAVPDVSGTVLPWSKVKRGDRISLQVTPVDGEMRGKPVITEEIVLPNSPPQFVSTPMLNFRADEYVYEAKAEDADRDPLTYALEAGPAGMTVNGATGRLIWRIGRDQAGDHLIKLVVTDPEKGRAVQEYTLSVTIP